MMNFDLILFNQSLVESNSSTDKDSLELYFSSYANSLNQLEKFRKINLVSTILFIVIGLIGHFLTIFVFAQKRFRKNSSNVYLLCLAVNDALYLIIHFFEDVIRTFIHLNEESLSPLIDKLNLIDRYNLSCQLINYLRYVFRFISAYIIVAFSVQRLIIINSPFTNKFKSTRSAWITVFLTTLISILINLWVPFLFEIKHEDGAQSCDVKKDWSTNYFHITLVYIFLIMFVPITIILVTNTLIILNILRTKTQPYLKERNQRLVKHTRRSNQLIQIKNDKIEVRNNNKYNKIKPYYLSIDQILKRVTSKANSTKRLTKILILISFSYAFLNLPYFVTWSFYYFEITFYKDEVIEHNLLYSAAEITEIFYILNYSIHFYIYCASGSMFRNQLRYSGKN